MPYQTIQYPKTGVPSSTEVTVHWSKGVEETGDAGYVQIQAERHVWVSQPDDVYPNGHAKTGCVCSSSNEECSTVPTSLKPDKVAESDAEKVAAADAGTGPDNPYARDRQEQRAAVVTEPLTRDQINALIKTLRRARDSAYGADA